MAGRPPAQYWVPERWVRDRFGIRKDSLTAAGISHRKENGRVEYNLDEIIKAFAIGRTDEIAIGDDDESLAALKAQKTAEEVRKLRNDNDEREGTLVRAAGVEAAYMRRMKAGAAILDGIPSAVKMRCPDIPAAALDAIRQALIEFRNKSCG